MTFPGFLKVAYRDKFIEEENWSRTNADGFDFFNNLNITSDSEYVSKALIILRKNRPHLLEKTGATNKSNVKSAATREKANQLFKEKKWYDALKSYSKSIALAENGSTELGFAYANRSALLLHRGFYKECLEDIDRALKLDYPADKKPQLITRQEKTRKLVPTQIKAIFKEVVPSMQTKNVYLKGASKSIKVAEDKTYGRFIEATTDIAPGEIILIEDPYSLVIAQDFKTTHCGNCAALCYNTVPCKNCSIEMYCSEKCRDKAYIEYHQYECIVLNFYPSEVFNIVDIPVEGRNACNVNKEKLRQLALRITLKGFRNYQNSVTDDPDGKLYEEIGKLQTHRSDLSKSALMILAINSARQFQILKKHTNFLAKLKFKDGEDILKYHLLRNRLVCCFNLATLQYKLDISKNAQTNCSPAIGMYSTFSMFNHSCVENVGYGFYGRTVVVRAIRKIKRGDQCYINYGYFFHEKPKAQRDFTITRNYLFTCKCIACQKEWPTLDIKTLFKGNCLMRSPALVMIETLRTLLGKENRINEDARQAAFIECAKIDHQIKNGGPGANVILFYDLLHSVVVLRYQGLHF